MVLRLVGLLEAALSAPLLVSALKRADGRSGGRAIEPVRQTLHNFKDVQYVGDIKVGNSNIRGIVDTGSFELLVFPKRCETCGTARGYDSGQSSTYVQGHTATNHSYGSGSCLSEDGRETVVMESLTAIDQPFWEAVSCEMDLLNFSTFNAIIGVGPPGYPKLKAQHTLDELEHKESNFTKSGKPVPKDVEDRLEQSKNLLQEALTKKSLLQSFGVTAFSACFGREKGSSGFVIWNDDISRHPGMTQMTVIGDAFWSVKISDITLYSQREKMNERVFKAHGGAVLDTGTSLLAVPSDVFKTMVRTLRDKLVYCFDLRKFPDLILDVDGKKLVFPPSAYVGKLYNEPAEDVKALIHYREYTRANDTEQEDDDIEFKASSRDDMMPGCELLLMDMGNEESEYGPTFILGVPFFREYYTTFDLGAGPGDRRVYIAPAADDCTPNFENDDEERDASRFDEPVLPRHVDASQLRAPEWLRNRFRDLL